MSEKYSKEKQVIINLDDYPEDGIFEIDLDSHTEDSDGIESCGLKGQVLLLVVQQGRYHVIENKCGHFGVPLSNASLQDNEIICAEHGISFDLDSGIVVNRPYENCDAIKVFNSTVISRQLHLQCF